MPSSANYKRDYKQEYANDSAERRKQRAMRNKARRQMMQQGKVKVGDGKDVDHKKPLSLGGSTSKNNLRVISASKNRSYPRTAKGAIKRK